MKSPAGWEKRLLLTLFITLFLVFMIQTSSVAFGPEIVDVTTKSFSVVWTTGGTYTSCGINLYESDFSTPDTDVEQDQIIVETDSNFPGEAGKGFGIAKVTVVGLNVYTLYYFKITQNGSELPQEYTVRTERLRGFNSTDSGDSDIVSNDIVHKAVYKSDGTSPATGVLVLADIYHYQVDPEATPNNTLSDYPVTAWVGEGMIGDEGNTYNPDNISYKQYAALNMNNLFGTDHYPLSLQGDDPDTSVNESEIVRFTIVHGTSSVYGEDPGGDAFTSFGLIEYVEKSGGEKITTAKVSASFKFEEGVSVFALPFIVSDGYSTGQLLLDIEEAEGKEDIVRSIYIFKETGWKRTYTSVNIFGERVVKFSYPLQAGQGCYIIMDENMTKEITFYGKPDSVLINLAPGVNLVTIPQLAAYYTTGNLLEDIENTNSVPDSVKSIYSFIQGAWKRTYSSVNIFGEKIIKFPYPMTNTRFNYIILEEDAPPITDWDPFNN